MTCLHDLLITPSPANSKYDLIHVENLQRRAGILDGRADGSLARGQYGGDMARPSTRTESLESSRGGSRDRSRRRVIDDLSLRAWEIAERRIDGSISATAAPPEQPSEPIPARLSRICAGWPGRSRNSR